MALTAYHPHSIQTPDTDVQSINFAAYYEDHVQPAQLGQKPDRHTAFDVCFICYDCKDKLTLRISASDIAQFNNKGQFMKPINWTTFKRNELVVMASGSTIPLLQCDVCNGLRAKGRLLAVIASARLLTKANIVEKLHEISKTCFHESEKY